MVCCCQTHTAPNFKPEKKTCLPPPVTILQRHIFLVFLDSMRHWAFLDILGSTWQLWHSCCDTRRVPRRIDGSGDDIQFGDFLKNSRPCEKCAEAILGFFGFFGPTLGSNGIQPEIQTVWPATISHATFSWFLWDSPGKKMISRTTFVFSACCITRFLFHLCFTHVSAETICMKTYASQSGQQWCHPMNRCRPTKMLRTVTALPRQGTRDLGQVQALVPVTPVTPPPTLQGMDNDLIRKIQKIHVERHLLEIYFPKTQV